MTNSLAGVQFNPPPPGPIAEAAMRITNEALSALPPGAKGGIFGIATTKGMNAVIVHKLNDHFRVAGWVAKSWGQPIEAGASVVMSW